MLNIYSIYREHPLTTNKYNFFIIMKNAEKRTMHLNKVYELFIEFVTSNTFLLLKYLCRGIRERA